MYSIGPMLEQRAQLSNNTNTRKYKTLKLKR